MKFSCLTDFFLTRPFFRSCLSMLDKSKVFIVFAFILPVPFIPLVNPVPALSFFPSKNNWNDMRTISTPDHRNRIC